MASAPDAHLNAAIETTTATHTSSSCDSELKPTYFVPNSFFVLVKQGEVRGNWMYKCAKCVNKTISASHKSRVNLVNHVKSKHNGSLKEFESLLDSNDRRRKRPAGVTDVDSESQSQQPKLANFLNRPTQSKLTQKDLDKLIINYIAQSVMPIHHVESEAFRGFVAHLAPKLVVKSRKTYRDQMKLDFDAFKTELKASMAKAQKICLTLDHWSSRHKGYLGVTAHWYGENSNRKHACIAMRRIMGRCTFDVLAKLIESIIIEYDISNKITHCVTDSGSNFVKAFAKFGTATEPDNSGDGLESDGLEPQGLMELLENPDSEQQEFQLPPHFRCAAHKLNLIASNNTPIDNPRSKKTFRSLMGKLTALWNKQSHSTVASDQIKQSLSKLLVTPNSTRYAVL